MEYDVPILGQPMTIRNWFPTVNIVCNCGKHASLLLVGFNAPTRCPDCGKGFVLQKAAQDVRIGGGVPSFHIAVAAAHQIEQTPPDEPPTPEPVN